MSKVIVHFYKGYLNFVPGDITQLEEDEAKKLAEKNVLAITSPVEAEQEALPDNVKNIVPDQSINELICPICGKECKNKAGLIAHKKVHGLD